MIDVQNAFRVAGRMVPAQYTFEAVAMQNAKAEAESDVSGILG